MSILTYVCNTTFENLEIKFFLVCEDSSRIRVKVVYEGHRVKVKVTAAKKCAISYVGNVELQSAITPVP